MKVTRGRFLKMAAAALAALPARFRRLASGVEIGVQAKPGLEAGRWAGSSSLLGLYVGAGQPKTPGRIILYQSNLSRLCSDEAALAREISVTLRHELGHHFGLGDARLRELGH